MAKSFYRVPTGINKSILDKEITLSAQGVGRTLPFSVILYHLACFIIIGWAVTHTFIAASVVWQIVFVIWALVATFYYGKYNESKEIRFEQVPSLVEYAIPSNRKIITRRNVNPAKFMNLVGISSIDMDDDSRSSGRIVFGNGDVGAMYLVVGSASVLLFDKDRDTILGGADAFYRKWPVDAELTIITAKEPQRVEAQIAHLVQVRDNMINTDADKLSLLEEQFKVLDGYVGTDFKSIHQYMLIRADSAESLKRAQAVITAEAERGMMLKSAVLLNGEAVVNALRPIYGH